MILVYSTSDNTSQVALSVYSSMFQNEKEEICLVKNASVSLTMI